MDNAPEFSQSSPSASASSEQHDGMVDADAHDPCGTMREAISRHKASAGGIRLIQKGLQLRPQRSTPAHLPATVATVAMEQKANGPAAVPTCSLSTDSAASVADHTADLETLDPAVEPRRKRQRASQQAVEPGSCDLGESETSAGAATAPCVTMPADARGGGVGVEDTAAENSSGPGAATSGGHVGRAAGSSCDGAAPAAGGGASADSGSSDAKDAGADSGGVDDGGAAAGDDGGARAGAASGDGGGSGSVDGSTAAGAGVGGPDPGVGAGADGGGAGVAAGGSSGSAAGVAGEPLPTGGSCGAGGGGGGSRRRAPVRLPATMNWNDERMRYLYDTAKSDSEAGRKPDYAEIRRRLGWDLHPDHGRVLARIRCKYRCMQCMVKNGIRLENRIMTRVKYPYPLVHRVREAVLAFPSGQATVKEVWDAIEADPLYGPYLDRRPDVVDGRRSTRWQKQVGRILARHPHFGFLLAGSREDGVKLYKYDPDHDVRKRDTDCFRRILAVLNASSNGDGDNNGSGEAGGVAGTPAAAAARSSASPPPGAAATAAAEAAGAAAGAEAEAVEAEPPAAAPAAEAPGKTASSQRNTTEVPAAPVPGAAARPPSEAPGEVAQAGPSAAGPAEQRGMDGGQCAGQAAAGVAGRGEAIDAGTAAGLRPQAGGGGGGGGSRSCDEGGEPAAGDGVGVGLRRPLRNRAAGTKRSAPAAAAAPAAARRPKRKGGAGCSSSMSYMAAAAAAALAALEAGGELEEQVVAAAALRGAKGAANA
ncbi:hypothetical protein PLESTF_001522000 [Pleodorina starrii]|nr:hypothetical protein PLESTF_001522000 [Pleodorina starrii]